MKYPDIDEFRAIVDAYFIDCDMNKQPYTQTGLIIALNCAKGTFDKYKSGHYGEDYKFILEMARLRVENYAEKQLFIPNGKTPNGAIFALKQFGWMDKAEVNLDSNLNINLVSFAEYQSTKQLETPGLSDTPLEISGGGG